DSTARPRSRNYKRDEFATEIQRQGGKETRGFSLFISPFPCLLVSLSPCLFLSVSPWLCGYMKTLAVVNPGAGFGKCAKLLGPALDRLRASGVRFDVAETKRAGHGIEIARNAWRDGYRKFFAVGGDGTSFEIVNGLFPEAADNAMRDGEKPTL